MHSTELSSVIELTIRHDRSITVTRTHTYLDENAKEVGNEITETTQEPGQPVPEDILVFIENATNSQFTRDT